MNSSCGLLFRAALSSAVDELQLTLVQGDENNRLLLTARLWPRLTLKPGARGEHSYVAVEAAGVLTSNDAPWSGNRGQAEVGRDLSTSPPHQP